MIARTGPPPLLLEQCDALLGLFSSNALLLRRLPLLMRVSQISLSLPLMLATQQVMISYKAGTTKETSLRLDVSSLEVAGATSCPLDAPPPPPPPAPPPPCPHPRCAAQLQRRCFFLPFDVPLPSCRLAFCRPSAKKA